MCLWSALGLSLKSREWWEGSGRVEEEEERVREEGVHQEWEIASWYMYKPVLVSNKKVYHILVRM